MQHPGRRLTRLARRTRSRRRNAAAGTLGKDPPGRAPADPGTIRSRDSGSAPPDTGRIAADIGAAALELAKQANRVGLTGLGYLLESAALEAGAEAASRAWPADGAEH